MAKRKKKVDTEVALNRLYSSEYNIIASDPDRFITTSTISYSDKLEMLESLMAVSLDKEEYENCALVKQWILDVKRHHGTEAR